MKTNKTGHDEGRFGANARGRRKLVLRLAATIMVIMALGLFTGGVIAYLTDQQSLVGRVSITQNFPTPTPTATPTPSPTPTIPLESFIFKVEWMGLKEEEPTPEFSVKLYRNVEINGKQVTQTSKHIFELDGDGYYHAWRMRPGDYWLKSEELEGFFPLYRNLDPNNLVVDKLYSGGTLVYYKIPETGDHRLPMALLWASALLCAAGMALMLVSSRMDGEAAQPDA